MLDIWWDAEGEGGEGGRGRRSSEEIGIGRWCVMNS